MPKQANTVFAWRTKLKTRNLPPGLPDFLCCERLIPQSSCKNSGSGLLAIIFLNDLNGGAHVTGIFEHANAIPECVDRIEVL
jgi:hypothetical protein